jgi:hypothetical protein
VKACKQPLSLISVEHLRKYLGKRLSFESMSSTT